jgi:hypothetical protein
MRRGRFSGGNLISATVAVVPTATELNGWGASGIKVLGGGRGQRFNQNGPGQFFTQGEAGVANLAYNIGFAAQEFDALLLAEAEFAQPVAQFGRCGQFLDANGCAGGYVVQRADRRPGTMAFNYLEIGRLFFHSGTT